MGPGAGFLRLTLVSGSSLGFRVKIQVNLVGILIPLLPSQGHWTPVSVFPPKCFCPQTVGSMQ